MILAIDVGNSSTAIGLFTQAGKLVFRSDLTTNRQSTRDQCAVNLMNVFRIYEAELQAVTGAIISSVVPSVTAAVSEAVTLLTGNTPLITGPGVKTGLNIKSDIHTQMGSDIVAYSVGAAAKYPSPLIVVEMGTAITISVLLGTVYEGCIIMPGVQVALDALSERAAGLPHIAIQPPPSILGHNTVDAMRSGVIYGNASMVDGMIDRLELDIGPAASLVGTGSVAPDILPYCRHDLIYDPDLLLDGLCLIYQKNTVKKVRR
ncbi:MAG: type III pantothenate kinase [Oscillospiraceae bacterium]|nr:type III pantothenate kinase [Oscillospiraceae bacterium]